MKNKRKLEKKKEVMRMYRKQVNEIRRNLFIKQKVTFLDRLFGTYESQADFMIKKCLIRAQIMMIDIDLL